jgi:hypothetical protein
MAVHGQVQVVEKRGLSAGQGCGVKPLRQGEGLHAISRKPEFSPQRA